MNNAAVWFGFLRAILSVISNTTLSQGKKDNALAYLDLAAALVAAGGDVNKGLAELTERVKQHTPITDADYEALKSRSDKAHEEIQKED